MKNIFAMVVGGLLIILANICPFPPLLGISGMAWRSVIGLFGCVVLCLGLYCSRKGRNFKEENNAQ